MHYKNELREWAWLRIMSSGNACAGSNAASHKLYQLQL